jgi:hypothetical protein
MEFLLYLPSAIALLLVSAAATAVAIAGLYLVRRRYAAEVLKANHEVAAIIFNVFGVLYAVVVAFVVFVTWSGYDEATKNLQLEASQTLDLFYSAQAFPEPLGKDIQQGLIAYANSVYTDELKRMSSGDISIHSSGILRELLAKFNSIDQNLMPNREVYVESLRRLNNLAEYRQLRIFAGNNTIPSVLWCILLAGGFITVLYTCFFGAKNLQAQYVMTAALTVMISLILLLIYILDHPFTGANKVSVKPFAETLEVMQAQEINWGSKLGVSQQILTDSARDKRWIRGGSIQHARLP